MGKYVANMDIQVDGKLFHESELITVNIREKNASFLLEHGMIRKQDEPEHVELEKKVQDSAEPEQVEPEKKVLKQGSKSRNSKEAK